MRTLPSKPLVAVLVAAVLVSASCSDSSSESTTTVVQQSSTSSDTSDATTASTATDTTSGSDPSTTTEDLDGSTGSTTSSSSPTTTTAPEPVAGPVYIVSDDLVVGWYEDGAWVRPDPTGIDPPPVVGVELRDLTGTPMGSIGADPEVGCFPEDERANWQVSLDGGTFVSGEHELQPRPVRESAPTPEYFDVLNSIVSDLGGSADVEIDRVWRFDLEGDGVDEALIEANSVDVDDSYDLVGGNYSILLLRRIGADGEVENITIHAEAAPDGDEFVYMTYFYVSGLADIDGNGVFELIAGYSGFEWFGVDVIDLSGDTTTLLNAGCGV